MLTGWKATPAWAMILDDAFFQRKTALCFGPFLFFGNQFLVRLLHGESFLSWCRSHDVLLLYPMACGPTAQLSSAPLGSRQLALGHNQSSKQLILLEKSILALPAYCLSRWEERVYSKKTPTGGNDAGRSYQQATAESPAVSVNSIT
jgi:hypothetical protein